MTNQNQTWKELLSSISEVFKGFEKMFKDTKEMMESQPIFNIRENIEETFGIILIIVVIILRIIKHRR